MNTLIDPDRGAFLLVTAMASPRQKRIAIAIAIVAVGAFLAAVPFARVPLAANARLHPQL